MARQVEVLDWLRSGQAWSGATPEIVETHAAVVFLVANRAFKLKKAVDLGYLDFSTLDKRRAVLERELVLNRRTAPNLYLGLRAVRRTGPVSFSFDGGGEVVEWLLEMRRFPANALLSEIADRSQLDENIIERLASHVALFHEQEPLIDRYDWPSAVARISSENTQDLRSQGHTLGASRIEEAIAARESAHVRCADALAEQSFEVRRCHGDLHLGNAFLEHDAPTLFDCIEFDDFYAVMPPLYDFSFLLMDLAARSLGRLANRALNRWWADRKPTSWRAIMRSLHALPLYLALRAEIRAKTTARIPLQLPRARGYLDLSPRLARQHPPILIAIGGLSGTGKSSAAHSVAWRVGVAPGAIHLRSDRIRKRLMGARDNDRLRPSDYTAATAARVYGEMLELAAQALVAGHSVVIDAVFAQRDEREAVAQMASGLNVPFHGFWLDTPQALLETRLSQRIGDASDADIAVLHKQLTYDLGAIDWLKVDASGSRESVAERISQSLALG